MYGFDAFGGGGREGKPPTLSPPSRQSLLGVTLQSLSLRVSDSAENLRLSILIFRKFKTLRRI